MKKILLIALITLFTTNLFAETYIIYEHNGHRYGVILPNNIDCSKLVKGDVDRIVDCWNAINLNQPILQTVTYIVNNTGMGLTFLNSATNNSQQIMDNAMINSYLASGNYVRVDSDNNMLTVSLMDNNPVVGPANVVSVVYQKPIPQLLAETN